MSIKIEYSKSLLTIQKIYSMKKIYINVLAIIAVTSALLSAALSAAAEEYKSIIRYDRIWEHISYHWEDRQVYHERFNGTEEINGKTYHQVISFRKSGFAFNDDGQTYLFDIDESYYQHEGYIREEDGKVYTIVINANPDSEVNGYDWYVLLNWRPNEEELPRIEEKLIYDFSCKEGESFVGHNVSSYMVTEVTFKVNSIEIIDINGEQCRKFNICPVDWVDFTFPMVEGIGIDGYGCLTTLNFLEVPTCPCINYEFNRVLSSEGDVQYRTHDCFDIPYNVAGMDGIDADPKESDATLYDAMGRRIAAPASGQLYIKDGKKHIAR